ncbi:lebercilin-like protein [Lucilia sericata]|uniref:lebercilin-like protein n=1 Tax=Lucilia sericata TaxID=13632 RepID=UPI0018A83639|nr:lebercilin-like protein [Lucilia sericata]XP_037807219.1 lebercilin-like protein [Lucilia sericata]
MVSPRKASSALSLIPEEEVKMNTTAAKSCESLYSNSSKGSANIIYRRKPTANANNKSGTRQPAIIPATNEVRQRVLSARRLRMKTYQNQLADAQQTIAELAHENRILRTLHKRQDSALSKYESTNAELPQLLHSHAEELRVWQSKYRNLQAVNKELEHKLKQKEAVILSLSDQNKYYIQLNKDKNLEDRQRLSEKLQMLETRLQEKDNDMKMMARKMQLEAKQAKQQLQTEQKKNKDILMKLEKARLELSGYRKLEELQLQEKFNLNLRRNKGGNYESSKDEKEIDKYSFANITDAEITDEIEVPNSQRSTHSTNNMIQRTTRSIKNTTNKNHLTVSSTSTTVIQHISKQQTPPNKSIAVLRRIDQGDGDASTLQDVYKPANTFNSTLMQKQHSNLSSMTQNQSEKLTSQDYEDDDDYENDDDNEDDEHEEVIKSADILGDNHYDDKEVNRDFVTNIDGTDNDDYYEETQKIELSTVGKKPNMKEEISSIRKQISDDYKEREAFLDTFCRQATNGVLRDETPKKRNSIATEHNVPSNRKHKLLAALKAIDDNKSQD